MSSIATADASGMEHPATTNPQRNSRLRNCSFLLETSAALRALEWETTAME